ncbi:hypothetical protein [Thioalkalivibrio sp. HK1]|uniref:hypothetical protein n=1 Tax=Thioalkalivibrio sp. HK1 TaxID=1469245 RepID=UPI0012DCB718|nr:hypothetical protein [Thioalkalivibrio sp. HK1]
MITAKSCDPERAWGKDSDGNALMRRKNGCFDPESALASSASPLASGGDGGRGWINATLRDRPKERKASPRGLITGSPKSVGCIDDLRPNEAHDA